MGRILGTATAIALGSLACERAQAAELRPLADLAANAEETYPLVRCSAFYLSLIEWAGADRIGGEEAANNVKITIHNVVTAAAQLRSEKSGGNLDDSYEITLRDVRNVADLYLKRYQSNYAAEGQAWGNDPLWTADEAVCAMLAGGTK
jgi:hypothetical protein